MGVAGKPLCRETDGRTAKPFEDAAAAWFWAVSALIARHAGCRARNSGSAPRPCEPDDVIRAVERLYHGGLIGAAHLRVLQRWGEAGMPPDRRLRADSRDLELWIAALDRLQGPLRAKGIVEDRLSRNMFLTSSAA